MIPCDKPRAEGLIHASAVRPVETCKFGRSAMRTFPDEPSKVKAWPTIPVVNVTPPYKVPELESIESLAFPSPRHQLIKPDEIGAQFVGGGPTGHLPALPAL